MSDWGHQDVHQANIQIAGRDWTPEVRRLCDIVGHSLAPDYRDQGKSGQYNACHADKQLVAYFVHKHLFLSHELEEEEEGGEEKLLSLKAAEPPVSLRRATIMVSRGVCYDCRSLRIW